MIPKHPDLVYDVGVHRGEDSEFYLKKGFRVVGIEADPGLAEHCRRKFQTAIEAGRLELIEGAVVDPTSAEASDGCITFYRNAEQSVWGTTDRSWAERNRRLGTSVSSVRVRALDFREVLKVHGIPHYLKIDIEGADRFCLEALLGCNSRPDYISIESEKVSFERLRAEIALFQRLGYESFQAVQQERVPKQRPPEPPREGRSVVHRFEHGSSGLFGGDLPDRWVDPAEILSQYRKIFLRYRCFGDDSLLRRYWAGQKFLALLRKVTRVPLPGWYDTHARLRTARADGAS